MEASGAGFKKIRAKKLNDHGKVVEGDVEILSSQDYVEFAGVQVLRYDLLLALGVTQADIDYIKGLPKD